eukprot:c37188_g1_i1 orf=2-154(-)
MGGTFPSNEKAQNIPPRHLTSPRKVLDTSLMGKFPLWERDHCPLVFPYGIQ